MVVATSSRRARTPSKRRTGRRGLAPMTSEDSSNVPVVPRQTLAAQTGSPGKRPVLIEAYDEENANPQIIAAPSVVAPKAPRSPSKKNKLNQGRGRPPRSGRPATPTKGGAEATKAPGGRKSIVITPGETPPFHEEEEEIATTKVRRSLAAGLGAAVTTDEEASSDSEASATASLSSASASASSLEPVKRGPFGRAVSSSSDSSSVTVTEVSPAIRAVYRAVNQRTGRLGGNGSGGAIYGELTVGSMQKMTDLMVEHTNLNSESRFIDVGCGLGKPNFHVATTPGVSFSYGIEMERVRWLLGMSNLDAVMDAAAKGNGGGGIGTKCILAHGDITEAKKFDPFTHVYMFDIGFPPKLFYTLADMYNTSTTPRYLICYHNPRLMIDTYGFDVELIVQTPTSMHGSAEGHMGYIYRRCGYEDEEETERDDGASESSKKRKVPCDPLFKPHWDDVTNLSPEELHWKVKVAVNDEYGGGRPRRTTRSQTRALQ